MYFGGSIGAMTLKSTDAILSINQSLMVKIDFTVFHKGINLINKSFK